MISGELKIYYSDSCLLLSPAAGQRNKNFTSVLETEADVEKFFSAKHQLFDGSLNKNIQAFVSEPAYWLRQLEKSSKLILAGGGLVWNERNELLMIHRKGRWDLPKGKLDEGENIRHCAQREVEEETGVRIESVGKNPIRTYHAYRLKEKDCLKETSWFEMTAMPGQDHLIPQAEEDITEVRWVGKSDFEKYKPECYMLIRDLLDILVK